MLTDKQRNRFANLFFGKLFQKLADKGSKTKTELKQFIEAKNEIREKELKLQKKTTWKNLGLISNLLKLV